MSTVDGYYTGKNHTEYFILFPYPLRIKGESYHGGAHMKKDGILKNKKILILAFLVLCMIGAFWIRVIPAESFSYSEYLGGAEPDIWYNLRQIEVMVHNFPQYNWYDPMTAFPTGKSIDWGPLFTILASGLTILMGASSRTELMTAASYMGPIIGVALVPVVFLLGRHIWDTWAGLIAALFISVGTFSLFYRTTYGYIDHHGLEALLSSVFVLTYLVALYYTQAHPVARKDPATLIRPGIFAGIAGTAFVLGLLNMPTMILFGLIVTLFTLVAFIFHVVTRTSTDYLLVVNSITFLIVLVMLPLIGMNPASMALSQYSLGQFLCYLLLIAGTAVLWGLGRISKDSIKYIIGILIIITAVIVLLSFSGSNILTEALSLFFGLESDVATIQEMQGYEVRFALLSYNYGLLLAAAGGIILLWKTWASRDVRVIFLLIWSLLMAIATLQHRRFEYYFAVNFALLSGVAVSWVFSTVEKDVHTFLKNIHERYSSQGKPESGDDEGEKTHSLKKLQKKTSAKRGGIKEKKTRTVRFTAPVLMKTLAFGLVLILAALFVVFSINTDLTYAEDPTPFMTDQVWVETLRWLNTHTPSTGVDYFGMYEKEHFAYPAQAYGVMAWWDYGHYITFIGERIPNTNPFQDNLGGQGGAAAFFIAQNEHDAAGILSHAKSRFIITDTKIVSQKFHAIASWYNSSVGIDPYRTWLYFPDRENQNQLKAIAFNTPEYYRTMITRMHLYDGSFTNPTTAYYIEYKESAGLVYPQVIASEEIDVASGMQKAEIFNSHALPGTQAAVLSSQVMYPLEALPALCHFRLVHESPADSTGVYAEGSDPRLRAIPFIKVFEYVKGARIPGDGTIEATIVTNTGREFTYRQKSVNGEFIVPYSTAGNSWEVRTKGNYRIVESGKEVIVREEDVI